MTVLMNNIVNLTVKRVEDHIKEMKAALAHEAEHGFQEVELDLRMIVHDLDAFMMLAVDSILGLEDAVGPGTPEVERTAVVVNDTPPAADNKEGTGQYL